MNHEIIKGKLFLGENNNLMVISNDYKYFIITKNMIILEDNYIKVSLDDSILSFNYKKTYERYINADEEDKEELYKDLYESFEELSNLDFDLKYVRNVETCISDIGNLNLINSGYFNQLTLDNQNNNIIMDYFDLHIFELNSLDDYDSFYKNIKIISNILDSNLNTNISKCCIYQDNSSPNNFYYALFDETSHKNIFVDANFLSHFSEEYIKELELSFSNKTVFNITPSKGNQNSNLLIALQKNIMIDNILKDLKSVDSDDIYLDVSPLYELIKFGKTVLSASDPLTLSIELTSDYFKDIAIKGFSKSAERLLNIDSNLIENVESFIINGPNEFLKDKISHTKIRIKSSSDKKDKDSDNLDL